MTTTDGSQRRPNPIGRVPHASAGAQLLMLLGLTGFAISQPVLAVAGENPATFAFRSVDGFGLIAFALAVAVVPPLVLWGLVRLVALAGARVADVLFAVLVGVLSALAGVQVVKAFDVEAPVLIALAGLLVAAAVVGAFLRFRATAQWLRYTAVLPVAAVGLFLLSSPTGALLRTQTVDTGRRDAGDAPPVVMLMLDELPTQSLLAPDGTVDAVRFPNLARLAERSTWYRDYTVPSNETLMAVPSILSGTLPDGTPALASSHPDTVFTLLAPTHDLFVYESATKLCDHPQCLDRRAATDTGGFGALLGDMAEVWRDRVWLGPTAEPNLGEFAEEVVAVSSGSGASSDLSAAGRLRRDIAATPTRVQDFLASFEQTGDRPGFHYLHLLLPHQPWTFYPDGSRYSGDFTIENDEWNRAIAEQRHLFQAQYADRLVGQMLDALERTGLDDEALLIVTADHGIAFVELPNGRKLGPDRLGAVAYAPLFVKLPGQTTGSISERNVTGTDLVPTIADVVGAPVTWPVVGAPVESDEVAARSRDKVIYDFGSGEQRTARKDVPFDDAARPSASARLIGPVAPDESPIAGLIRRLGVADLLGARVDELGAASSPGRATFLNMAALGVEPQPGLEFPSDLLVVTGADASDGDLALVAVDDVIVSATPLVGLRGPVLWPSVDLLAPAPDRVRVLVGQPGAWREVAFE